MSERKVLNVSTKQITASHGVRSPVRTDNLYLLSLHILEILPAGFRSVEDPAHETGEESPVHRAIDGAVQYAMQDMR